MNRKETGDLGEKIARDYLEKRGYVIIETNYRSPAGEIDIVTRQGESIVFVEVRTKRSQSFGTAEESVTRLKQRHLAATAEYYYQSHKDLPLNYRIDFVAIDLGADNKPTRINHIENAVTGE